MNAKAIFIYLLGLISGVAVFAAAYAVAQWELGFTSSFLGLALFCALCVWVIADNPPTTEQVIDGINETVESGATVLERRNRGG